MRHAAAEDTVKLEPTGWTDFKGSGATGTIYCHSPTDGLRNRVRYFGESALIDQPRHRTSPTPPRHKDDRVQKTAVSNNKKNMKDSFRFIKLR